MRSKTLTGRCRRRCATALAKDAAASGLARVSIADDPIYEALPPFLVFGASDVALPPGVFIQAMGAAEQRDGGSWLWQASAKSKPSLICFQALVRLHFRSQLRQKCLRSIVTRLRLQALAKAVKQATGIKPITTLVRDLFREPLSALELNEHDAVVFDPPRAGAEAQAKMLASSKVKTVVAVSCNPATLARDARVLIDGGYKMETVTPIDQFHYSPHIEAVAGVPALT